MYEMWGMSKKHQETENRFVNSLGMEKNHQVLEKDPNDEEKYFIELRRKLLQIPLPSKNFVICSKFFSVCKYRGLKAAFSETTRCSKRKMAK